MKKFIVNVLDEAEQATKDNIFNILTFALRNEIVSVDDCVDGKPVTPKTVTIEYHSGDNGQEVDHTIEAQVCPNCGSDNIELFYEMYWGGGEKSPYQIKCVDCRICGPEADTIPAAVELWNRITMS